MSFSENQIIFYKLLQKLYGSGTIREGVKNFEINPVFIIDNLKQKGFPVSDVQIQTGWIHLFLYFGLQIAFFQVIPEEAFTHDG